MDLEESAALIGAEHGREAAQWVFDGNTPEEMYQRVLKGIEKGDPEVNDAYRTPSLSGEFAGDYGAEDLELELGVGDRDPDKLSALYVSYEEAAYKAFWHEVERLAREHLS